MRTLLIACGNPLRCDDGVGPEALRLIAPAPDREFRAVQQLTPECAEEISCFDRVIFLDADADAAHTHAVIEPLSAAPSRSPLTHASTPAEIVALSKALFGFTGEALVCRIPARDFSPADHLTQDGLRLVKETAARLECLLYDWSVSYDANNSPRHGQPCP